MSDSYGGEAVKRKYDAHRVRAFAVLWLTYGGYYFCRNCYFVAKPAIGESLGFANSQLGAIDLAFMSAYAFGQFVNGPLGDRISVKRIIGLPGETVEIKMGIVYICQEDEALPLEEQAYIAAAPHYTMEKFQVPEDSYFVLGDNRNNSNDSHNRWVVPRESIIGKAWLSIWPPTEWGLAANFPLEEQVASAQEQ